MIIGKDRQFNELMQLARHDTHNILIEGAYGSGKTYLAKQYAKLLNDCDFQVVNPTVSDIQDSIDEAYQISTPIVICVENLDRGVIGAAYTMLKFLEEPPTNVYIIITCQNVYSIPDTIISRCSRIVLDVPTHENLIDFAKHIDESMYIKLSNNPVFNSIRSYKDVDTVMRLSPERLKYFEGLRKLLTARESISSLVWKLGHYADNSELPIPLAINYLIYSSKNRGIKLKLIQCLKDLSLGYIGKPAVLSKLFMDIKYSE